MELNAKNMKKLLLLALGVAVIFCAVLNFEGVLLFLGKIISIFSPVIAALCIAFVLNILLTALENKVFGFMGRSNKKIVQKLRRPLCLVLTYLLALGAISLLILVIIPDLIDTVTYLVEKLPAFVVEARNWVENLLQNFNIEQEDIPDIAIDWVALGNTVKDWLSGTSGKLMGDAVNITTSVVGGVFDTVFSFVISVYVLAQKERIGRFVKRMISAFLPDKASGILYHIAYSTQEYFSRFIGGQLVEALILGFLCFIGMTIFGFPNALIISVLVCVTALVPIIGATIGCVVGALLIVISDPIKALLFVVFFLVLQQIEGNLIYPKVVGKAVGLPGVLVVSAVMIGGNIGGVMGTLIAVPTCAVLYTLLREAVDELTRIKKGIIPPISKTE